MSSSEEHRRQREMLGAFALGGLSADEALAVSAHLDGCASCRAELAEIAPLAQDLRTVDLTQVDVVITPPADLGRRIHDLVAQESEWQDARVARDVRRSARTRRSRAAGRLVTAAAAIALAIAGGMVLEASQDGPTSPTVPMEALQLVPVGVEGLRVTKAALVAHKWGVEVRMAASGFTAGATYRAALGTKDGTMVPAGEFLGTGSRDLRCNLQAAALRPDATSFVIMDATGKTVLTAELPKAS